LPPTLSATEADKGGAPEEDDRAPEEDGGAPTSFELVAARAAAAVPSVLLSSTTKM
jgi:hypothetical protein